MTAAARVGRKAALDGRLAKAGARGLAFARIAVKVFAEPPDYFDPVAVDAYWTLVTDLGEARELSRCDAMLIEMAARAYSRYVALDREIVAATDETGAKGFLSGKAQARAAAEKSYIRAVSELGITPSARIRSAGALQGTLFPLLDASNKAKPQDSVYTARHGLKVVSG